MAERVESPAMFSAARVMLARNSIEQLATNCLSPAVTATYILSGNDPEKMNFEHAGRIAVTLAITIRTEVSKQLESLLTREDSDAYLQRLALDIGADLKGKGAA